MITPERVRNSLDEVFAALDALCNLPRERLETRPDLPDAWSAAEHLEHVTLANHFLLLTATKGCAKAVSRARSGALPGGESDLAILAPIAEPGAFDWPPPLHMLPTGRQSVAESREKLQAQHQSCLALLAQLPGGEGRLHTLNMSVNRLGRLDLYQWLYFIGQHARYHLNLLKPRL